MLAWETPERRDAIIAGLRFTRFKNSITSADVSGRTRAPPIAQSMAWIIRSLKNM